LPLSGSLEVEHGRAPAAAGCTRATAVGAALCALAASLTLRLHNPLLTPLAHISFEPSRTAVGQRRVTRTRARVQGFLVSLSGGASRFLSLTRQTHRLRFNGIPTIYSYALGASLAPLRRVLIYTRMRASYRLRMI
jgi:hypothetical protein